MSRIVQTLTNGWEFSFGTSPSPAGKGRQVDLPHDWGINSPFCESMNWGCEQGFRQWFGTGWYRRTIHCAEVREDRRYFLHCDGIYENSSVMINGHVCGGHGYGYSPFTVEISHALKVGDNDLLISVDNTEGPTDRWYSGAGIYRTVSFLDLPECYLDPSECLIHQAVDPVRHEALLSVTPGFVDGRAGSRVRTGRSEANNIQEYSARVCIRGKAGELISEVSGPVSGMNMKLKHIQLWDADNPYLYTITLSLLDAQGSVIDSFSQKIGLRDVAFSPEKGMLVNGRKTVFKGVCLHQDIGCLGSASTPEILRARLQQLKSMGCNGLRLAHHAYPSIMLDLADSMGFYVYAEAFDKWKSGHYKRYFAADWHGDLAAMIKRDRNRPSILMWGVGNEVENQGQQSMLAILQDMVAYAHKLDSSRPVGCALSPHFQYGTTHAPSNDGVLQATDDVKDSDEITDPDERIKRIKAVADISDLVAVNYCDQWYERIHAMIPDKPIFGTETYQYFQGHELQMQDYQENNPNLLPLRREYLVGGAIWSGFDYLGESMGWPSHGWSGALIRTNGQPKAGYWLMKSYWTDKPFIHFMVADYGQADENVKEHWDLPPYVHHWEFPQVHKALIPYMVASNCDEVRIQVNGREIYLSPLDSWPNRVITGYLPYQPGEIIVKGYKNSVEVCRQVTRTPVSVAVGLQICDLATGEVLPDNVSLPCRRGYLKEISFRAVDKESNPVFNESAMVHVRVQGPVELAAMDNGNMMSSEPYSSHALHMNQGIVSLFVRSTGLPGKAVVYATAPGMKACTVTLLCQSKDDDYENQ